MFSELKAIHRELHWDETRSIKIRVTLSVQNGMALPSCGMRLCLSWKCGPTGLGGARHCSVEDLDRLCQGQSLELVLSGAEIEGSVDLEAILLSDGPGSGIWEPVFTGSKLWSEERRIECAGTLGFPVACGKFVKGPHSRAPWRLEVTPECYSANLYGGPMLVVNEAHRDGAKLIADPDAHDLTQRAAADVLRTLILGIVLFRESDQQFQSGSLGFGLSTWILSTTGMEPTAFGDRLKLEPGLLDELIAEYVFGGYE